MTEEKKPGWTKVWNSVLLDTNLSAVDKVVWSLIKMFSNGKDSFAVELTHRHLAELAGVSISTVKRSLSKLKSFEYLTINYDGHNSTKTALPGDMSKPIVSLMNPCMVSPVNPQVTHEPCIVSP